MFGCLISSEVCKGDKVSLPLTTWAHIYFLKLLEILNNFLKHVVEAPSCTTVALFYIHSCPTCHLDFRQLSEGDVTLMTLDDFGTAASLYVKHVARHCCNISSAGYTIFHSVLLMFKTL